MDKGRLVTKISHLTSDNIERQPCEHGTMCMVNPDGSLCLWECSRCEDEKEQRDAIRRRPAELLAQYSRLMFRGYRDYRAIPKRFLGKTIREYASGSKEQQKIKQICINYVQNFDQVLADGTSMVFCGKPGTGKTHLAYAVVQALQIQYVAATLITAADMTGLVKSTYSSDLQASDVVRDLASFSLLIIDEVGVQVSSDAERRIFFDVLNKRYENVLPTVLISNLTMEELTSFVGERVIDRMREGSGMVFAFGWESYRK